MGGGDVENQIDNLERFRELMLMHGMDLIWGLIIIVFGLILIKYVTRLIKKLLGLMSLKNALIATVSNAFHVLMLIVLISAVAVQIGADSRVFFRTMFSIALVVVALILMLRPYIPTLSFKAGNTVKIGNLLGKVEAITLLNTRIRTFDGKTIFVPNKAVLSDIMINYHYTPTRRIKLNIGIRYDQDLMRAKQILEELMIKDPRVLVTPRPVVYVLDLTDSCVDLGARCWVPNLKYWTTRCELLEKAKLRFDHEGIIIAFPRREVHLYHKKEAAGVEVKPKLDELVKSRHAGENRRPDRP